jgi:uncharacterized cupin superfamily protein
VTILPPDAHTADLTYQHLPAEQVVSGPAPRVGERLLGDVAGASVGIWEIEPSVTCDVEIDEVFVVLSGDATVQFEDGTPDLELRPGSLVRVHTGQKTRWIVRDTLRKVFVAAT